jgi:hypothetical protein
MINKENVLQLVHAKCDIQYDHTADVHRYVVAVFCNRVNDAGLDTTEEQVAEAIIEAEDRLSSYW